MFGVLSGIGGSLGLYLGISLLDSYQIIKLLGLCFTKLREKISAIEIL